MSQKNWMVKLRRKVGSDVSPIFIETRVIAADSFAATRIAENMHPGYQGSGVKEIKEPTSRGQPLFNEGSSSSGSSSDDSLGCRGILSGLITLVSLLIVLALVSKCGGHSAGPEPSRTESASSVQGVTIDADTGAAPDSGSGLELVQATPDATSNQVTEGAVIPALEISTSEFARIVDSRKSVVLQSGPRMASKNVTKIETGSVVEVISREGKWVRVRTAGGLLGYVRQSQLEPLE